METGARTWIDRIQDLQDIDAYRDQHWEGSFEEYLELARQNPHVIRTAYQRLFDMIISHGTEEYTEYKKTITHYKFFNDPLGGGRDAVYGLDISLQKLVNVFKSASFGYGTERRVILLHGPVGSSKSTIVRVLKRGLEDYSKKPEGMLFTYYWNLEGVDGMEDDLFPCPMHEEPMHLIPVAIREQVLSDLFGDIESKYPLKVEGDMCPACRYVFQKLIEKYDGDWKRVVQHTRIRRLILSEQDRVGIGTFQPKDEKNQDSTELTGDINYRKIALYGSDSDPRAFNFDGEFNIANRGVVEFIEVLKLDVAFLYDLLGASQEHKIKPKKFAQTDIDEVIIGHTNEPEYRKLQNNEFMEALRDRTVKIDIPYITKLDKEVQIYRKDYSNERVKGKHVAPHTLEMAAMWVLMTRLEQPKKAQLSLLQKLKLYNGQSVTGYTEDNVKELRKEAVREGLEGVSPRYVQDKLSNGLVSQEVEGCLNPFFVLNELEAGLKHSALITSEDQKKRWQELFIPVKEEYENIVKSEVQRAISADEEAISRLCANYIDNVKAYTQKEKVRNRYTGQDEEPDERLMRSIEEKIEIPESRKDDFRREIMNYIGALAVEGKVFNYKTNARLQRALELKLFEDQKDSIKLSSLVTNVVDQETQKKIDVVKERLMRNYGYCEICAGDVLNFVSSIFARGDVQGEDA